MRFLCLPRNMQGYNENIQFEIRVLICGLNNNNNNIHQRTKDSASNNIKENKR